MRFGDYLDERREGVIGRAKTCSRAASQKRIRESS